jgi:protoheme IX farnesyltransferase
MFPFARATGGVPHVSSVPPVELMGAVLSAAIATDVEEPAATRAVAVRPSLITDLYHLTKPGIARLVLLTTAVGFYLSSSGAVDLWLLFHVLLGTGLVASGSGVLNQLFERDVDSRMHRTRDRPLPAQRVSVAAAGWFGWSLSLVGLVYLALLVNLTTAAVVAASLVTYLFLYTPLKRRTSASTIAGTVPGALPIVAGWTAAGGPIDLRAATLFAILALWQIPHFLALAWLYREDYRRGGLVMLTIDDDDGRKTSGQILNYAVALLAVSLMPTILGVAGGIYFGGAMVLGVAFLATGAALTLKRTDRRARRLFLASVVYLPLLLLLMALDKLQP